MWSATGTILVSPSDETSKAYRLKIGNPDDPDGNTDSMFVKSVSRHWYSISSHEKYTVSDASWSNGGKLTFHDPDCTIPNKNVRVYCIADDGKSYYVGIESVEPSLNTSSAPESTTTL